MTLLLGNALNAWQTPGFNAVLKHEIEGQGADLLPLLQRALTRGSHALADRLGATILASGEDAEHLNVKAGLFYTSIIAGCSCADDPTPIDEIDEYCEVRIVIDKATAQATVTLVEE